MKKSIAFIFPGQGSQKVGMGKDLYNSYSEAKDVFKRVDEALNQKLSKIIFDGDENELKLTSNTQPALMAVSLAIIKVLESKIGKKISDFLEIVLGHSLGEYSSLCSIGSIGLEDTAKILRIRGDAMQNSVKNIKTRMVAVLGLDIEKVEEKLEELSKDTSFLCEVANDNCPGQVILSGLASSLDLVEKEFKSIGARSLIDLPVSAPFHCSLMQPASEIMVEALEKLYIQEPKVKFINNVSAEFLSEPGEIKIKLAEQVCKRVRWRESILKVSQSNIETIIEVGSGKVLTGLNKRMKIDKRFDNISSLDDMEKFLKLYGEKI